MQSAFICYHLNCGKPFIDRPIETGMIVSEVKLLEESEELQTYINKCQICQTAQMEYLAPKKVCLCLSWKWRYVPHLW